MIVAARALVALAWLPVFAVRRVDTLDVRTGVAPLRTEMLRERVAVDLVAGVLTLERAAAIRAAPVVPILRPETLVGFFTASFSEYAIVAGHLRASSQKSLLPWRPRCRCR